MINHLMRVNEISLALFLSPFLSLSLPPLPIIFGTLKIGASSEVNLSASENLMDDGTTEQGLVSVETAMLLQDEDEDTESRNGKGGSFGDKVLQSCAAEWPDLLVADIDLDPLVNANFRHHFFSANEFDLTVLLLCLLLL